MKHIVADAGPLIILARSGLLPALHEIAGQVLVPVTVFEECTGQETKPGAASVPAAAAKGLLTVQPDPALRDAAANIGLDPGEQAAIAMALELGCPVLADDRRARSAARPLGVHCLGSAAVLVKAKQIGLIPEVGAVLALWKDYGYFLSDALLKTVLELAGE